MLVLLGTLSGSGRAQPVPTAPAAPGVSLPGLSVQPTPGMRPPAAATGSAGFSDPRSAVTALEQTERLIREGNRAGALATLDAALRDHPRNPQLRFLYGVLLAEGGRADDAIAVFEQLTQDFPELPEPHNNLAVMLAARGELDRARVALENAVRALPGYALAQENLGDVYLRMAERAWARAGQLDPAGAASREKLGLARELIRRITRQP